MKLLMIHGRDQQGQNPHDLRQFWLESLKRGLQKSKLELPENFDIVFPFFGDTLDELVKQIRLHEEIEGVITRGKVDSNQAEFLGEVIQEISINAKISQEAIEENYEGDYLERGLLNKVWMRAILKTIDQHTPFGLNFIQRFAYDVFVYLTISGIRNKIDELILKNITDDTYVVVGHSLGSVIAYNVLKNNPSIRVKKFITLGSPLGLKSVKSKLDVPIVTPKCIKNGWFNAYDKCDYIALIPLDRKNFDITPAIENKSDVSNSTDNRHGISGYLEDPEVAKVIYEALELATNT